MMKAKQAPIKYTYIGEGAFLYGLPARDLMPEEISPEMESTLKRAIELNLYKPVLGEETDEKSN